MKLQALVPSLSVVETYTIEYQPKQRRHSLRLHGARLIRTRQQYHFVGRVDPASRETVSIGSGTFIASLSPGKLPVSIVTTR